MFKRLVCLLVCIAVCSAAGGPAVQAQDGEEIVKGLLRALIESQVRKAQRKNQNIPPENNIRPGRLTPEMQKLQTLAAGFAQETATLTALLNTDSKRSFEARRHQTDVFNLNATATALSQHAAGQQNHLAVVDGFRQLNSDWTALSHRLENCSGISNSTRACIKRLARLDEQYCELLNIQPRLDNAQLVRQAYSLSTNLSILTNDIRQLELRGANPAIHQLRLKTARIASDAEDFARVVAASAGYETIVRNYRPLHQDWQSIHRQIRDLQGPQFTRSHKRIEETHRDIHQLLGLEIGMDREQLLHLVHETQDSLQDLARSVTLEQLMAMPDATAVPAALADVYGHVENLDSLLHLNEDAQAVAEAWVYLDEAWRMLAYYLGLSNDTKTQHLLSAIGQEIHALKVIIGVTVQFDRDAAVRSASFLEEQTHQLLDVIHDWHRRPGSHDRSIDNLAHRLEDSCHSLEQSLARGHEADHCRRLCDEVIRRWQQVRPKLNDCRTPERQSIDRIAADFTTELIRLRTMLEE